MNDLIQKRAHENVGSSHGTVEPDNELKPCPWCGKPPTLQGERSHDNEPFDYWVGCINAKCTVRPITEGVHEYQNEGQAIAAWNNRAPEVTK